MTPDFDLNEIIAKYGYNGTEMEILFLDMDKFFKIVSQKSKPDMVSNLAEAIVGQIRVGNEDVIKSNLQDLNEFMNKSSFEEKVKSIQEKISMCLSLILAHLSDYCRECEMEHKKCHELFDAHRDVILSLTMLDLESNEKYSKMRNFLEKLMELSWSKRGIQDESILQIEN